MSMEETDRVAKVTNLVKEREHEGGIEKQMAELRQAATMVNGGEGVAAKSKKWVSQIVRILWVAVAR